MPTLQVFQSPLTEVFVLGKAPIACADTITPNAE